MPLQLLENISLQKLNTFGMDVHARRFASVDDLETLKELAEACLRHNDPTLILGGGSNILFTGDVDACVIKNDIRGIELISQDEDYWYIKAGAGENWHSFVMYCIERGFAGVENLALIPGNVGASPMQNIGAYGVEIEDVFHSLEAFHLKERQSTIFSKTDCAFGYRESVFKNRYKNQFVITAVTYRLRKKPEFNISYGAIGQELEKMGVFNLSIESVATAVMNIRRSKLPDPAVIGNAGSFFKNPEISATHFHELKKSYPEMVGYPVNEDGYKIAAGWLIEQCGWKGYRKGDAGCHEKQALVLVNHGKASGQEIYALSEEIMISVKNKYGIQLQREVNIIPEIGKQSGSGE